MRYKGIYKQLSESEVFRDKETAIRAILSVYLDYRCIPTELNDNEPEDPLGLGILEILCLKLIAMPTHTRIIRDTYQKLDEMYNSIVKQRVSIEKVIDQNFTLDQLRDYGF